MDRIIVEPPIQPLFGSMSPAPECTGAWFWHSGGGEKGQTFLSDEEAMRISRMVDPHLRNRLATYLAERRGLLADLLACSADKLRIGHDADGKPFLPDFPGVEISLSDSLDWNALAISRQSPVGIDIEQVRMLAWERMLPMICDEAEAETIRVAAGESRMPVAFYRCWTAKEAVLKAAGKGMRGDARSIFLPVSFIQGDVNACEIIRLSAGYRIEVFETNEAVISRALQL